MKKLVAALVAFSFATGSFACVVGHAWVDGHKGAKPHAQAKAPQKRAAKPGKSQATILDKRAEAAAAL